MRTVHADGGILLEGRRHAGVVHRDQPAVWRTTGSMDQR
jgi:hypothetical protein